MKTVNKLDINFIKDAIIDIRFSTNIPGEAIFGVLFNKLIKLFPKYQKLPILNFPEIIRDQNPDFNYKPHYRFFDNHYSFQFGPQTAIFNSSPKYDGWELYSKRLYDTLDILNECNFIYTIERIGLRFINLFSEDIYEHINLDISMTSGNLKFDNQYLKAEIKDDIFISNLQISNKVDLQLIDNSRFQGSVIDVDVFTSSINDNFINVRSIIENAHTKEKKIFFELIKKDFIKKYNPEFKEA